MIAQDQRTMDYMAWHLPWLAHVTICSEDDAEYRFSFVVAERDQLLRPFAQKESICKEQCLGAGRSIILNILA